MPMMQRILLLDRHYTGMRLKRLLLSAVLALLSSPAAVPASGSLGKTLDAVQQELGDEGFESAMELLRDSVCSSRKTVAANAAKDAIQLAVGLGHARVALREHTLASAEQVMRIVAGCAAESRSDPVQVATEPSSPTARKAGPRKPR